jgi:hypothetical protein
MSSWGIRSGFADCCEVKDDVLVGLGGTDSVQERAGNNFASTGLQTDEALVCETADVWLDVRPPEVLKYVG